MRGSQLKRAISGGVRAALIVTAIASTRYPKAFNVKSGPPRLKWMYAVVSVSSTMAAVMAASATRVLGGFVMGIVRAPLMNSLFVRSEYRLPRCYCQAARYDRAGTRGSRDRRGRNR